MMLRYVPLWLVLEAPAGDEERRWVTFDAERVSFGLGVWRGERAWSLGGHAGFFETLERLAESARESGDRC